MAKTKNEIVTSALTEIGIADFEFDATTAEGLSGVDRLNTMMAYWSSININVSYNFEGAVGADSGLPISSYEAVIANLAIRLATSYGKQIPQQVLASAKAGLTALLGESAKPIERQLGVLPFGAGHKKVHDDWILITNPFSETDEYDDFSAGESQVYVGDIGAIIGVDLAGTVDLAIATATSIKFRRPDGTEGAWTGAVSGEIVQYTTVDADDLDQSGVWYLQATFVLPTWTGSSKVTSIRVGRVLEGE
jgi:hypothetical protein